MYEVIVLNILLIEDNEIISKSLKYNLELNDYKVVIAPDIITSKEYPRENNK